MKIDITLIPAEVKTIAERAANLTNEMKAALQSNTAIEVEALVDKVFPEATTVRAGLISLCDAALKGCTACEAAMDKVGTSARLQRLGSDITKLQHDSDKHTLSWYISAFELVFNDIFGSTAA